VDLVEVVEADEPVERRGQIICGRWSLPCLRCLAARQIMLQRPSQLLPLDDPISLPRWPAPLLNLFDLPSNRIRIDFGSAVATGGEVVRHLDTAALQWASGGVENIPTACGGSDVKGKDERFEGLAKPDASCGVRSHAGGRAFACVRGGRSSPLPTLGSSARTSRSPCSAHT